MAAFAGIFVGVSVALTGVGLGVLVGGPVGAVILGAISALFAIPYGRAVALGKQYRGATGAFLCVIDATWSSLNTWAGAIYYGIHRMAGNTHDAAKSAGTGSIWLTKGVVAKYATTIGLVKAGSGPTIDKHEEIHILQARIFGPLYLPLVGANYVLATVLPYWLLFRDKEKHPISGFGSYFEHGVYPHVWNELWAYRYGH